MKRILLILLFSCAGGSLFAQYVYTIKADTVKITAGCDSGELVLKNHTQGVLGFLFNTGNGRTQFKRGVEKVNDSVFIIGTDTLKVPLFPAFNNGNATLWDSATKSFDLGGGQNGDIYVNSHLHGIEWDSLDYWVENLPGGRSHDFWDSAYGSLFSIYGYPASPTIGGTKLAFQSPGTGVGYGVIAGDSGQLSMSFLWNIPGHFGDELNQIMLSRDGIGMSTLYGGMNLNSDLDINLTTGSDLVFNAYNTYGYQFQSLPLYLPSSDTTQVTPLTIGTDGYLHVSDWTTFKSGLGIGGSVSPGGSNQNIQFLSNTSGTSIFQGVNNFKYDSTNSLMTVQRNGLGTTQAFPAGISIVNNTAAANGSQQISPPLTLGGHFWNTASGGSSKAVLMRQFTNGGQANPPTAYLEFDYSLDSGSTWTPTASIGNKGINFGVAGSPAANEIVGNNPGGLTLYNNGSPNGTGTFSWFVGGSGNINTSGSTSGLKMGNGYSASTGTGNFDNALINGTINQSGSASGTMTGLHISNVLTSVTGTYNALWVENGKSIFTGVQYGYVAKTGTYTATANDHIINCTSGTFTITLPTAVGISGFEYIVKNSGTGVITVGTTSSQTIDGSTTFSLGSQYKYVNVVSNGANWIVTGNN